MIPYLDYILGCLHERAKGRCHHGCLYLHVLNSEHTSKNYVISDMRVVNTVSLCYSFVKRRQKLDSFSYNCFPNQIWCSDTLFQLIHSRVTLLGILCRRRGNAMWRPPLEPLSASDSNPRHKSRSVRSFFGADSDWDSSSSFLFSCWEIWRRRRKGNLR